jgi:hypothetical protein
VSGSYTLIYFNLPCSKFSTGAMCCNSSSSVKSLPNSKFPSLSKSEQNSIYFLTVSLLFSAKISSNKEVKEF